MHDKDTNLVYFSPWLKDKKEGHPEFYKHLKNLLNEMGIEFKELKSTYDYWARVLKTEDIHPPKTGISVHFSGSLV